ncbi:MAG: translation initiation factor IF-3 [Patescibacteria group bacterium]|nr:translation initiation factor IF-3 [Patescibacteria group bacterium]
MRKTWRKAKPKPEKRFYYNKQIRANKVFLIDENGDNISDVPLADALKQAQNLGLDLVEVNPAAKPPVCKIMNYGQFKYQQEKKKHKQKTQQKKVGIKGIRLSIRISEHDKKFRQEQAKKFLLKRNKLKIELVLKGRERAHPEKAREAINSFVQELENIDELNIEREQNLTRQGGRYTMILVNKKE